MTAPSPAFPASLFDRFVEHSRRGERCVFLETNRTDSENRRSLLFVEPEGTLEFHAGDDVASFFSSLQARLDTGLWAAGYFTYEFGYALEPRLTGLLDSHAGDGPLAWLGFFGTPAVDTTDALEQPSSAGTGGVRGLSLNISRDEYETAFARIKSWIEEGETYQVNYTLKYLFDLDGPPELLYEKLRGRQRVSYAACLNDGRRSVISLSPELFFRANGDELVARPMKGTVRRGERPSEDKQLEAWLREDPKNRAENVMIVDMIRNDLGRISVPGGVRAESLLDIERYETLFQMTSTVCAKRRPGVTWHEVMEALFPCASVTGAPKIRTMELIAELEKEPRGIYTGAIGYFAPDGTAAFNVAIRTLVVERGGRGEMGIGSGVVYDSHGAREFDECLLKGRFLDECVESFSLVETMRLENGQIHLLERHLARLEHSAARLGFPSPLGVPAELAAVTRAHPGGRFKIRLLFDREGRTDLTIERQPEAPVPPLRFALGTEPVRSNEVLLRHKTTHRPLYQRAWKVAGENALDEIVFRNERDEITEGTRTNIFVEIDGVMWTPPVGSGLLAGTLRGHLLSAGKCRERVLEASDLFGADRIFLGNSVMGLVDAQCEGSAGEAEGAQRGG